MLRLRGYGFRASRQGLGCNYGFRNEGFRALSLKRLGLV